MVEAGRADVFVYVVGKTHPYKIEVFGAAFSTGFGPFVVSAKHKVESMLKQQYVEVETDRYIPVERIRQVEVRYYERKAMVLP